jgi:hypothetical protein
MAIQKSLIVFMCLLFFVGPMAHSAAMNSNELGINAGLGFGGSTKTVIGLGIDYSLTKSLILSLNTSADSIGGMRSLGLKTYFNEAKSGARFWTKCWFLFDCVEYNFGGLHFQNTPTQELRFYETDENLQNGTNTSVVYRRENANFALFQFGWRTNFSAGIVTEWEISYRVKTSGGKLDLISGTPTDYSTEHAIRTGYYTMGSSYSIGYVF